MADRSFPQRPGIPPLRPNAVERVVRRPPLSPIHEVLSLTIHDSINDPGSRRLVTDFYKVTRWIENESWLRRSLED